MLHFCHNFTHVIFICKIVAQSMAWVSNYILQYHEWCNHFSMYSSICHLYSSYVSRFTNKSIHIYISSFSCQSIDIHLIIPMPRMAQVTIFLVHCLTRVGGQHIRLPLCRHMHPLCCLIWVRGWSVMQHTYVSHICSSCSRGTTYITHTTQGGCFQDMKE